MVILLCMSVVTLHQWYCMANPALLFYHSILCFQAHSTSLHVHLECWVYLLDGILWLESM